MEPWTKKDRERILRTNVIDTGDGTLFGYVDKRPVTDNRLMLVISTGGSGKSIIEETLKTARQKLKPDFSNRVKFLAVDSDSADLAKTSKQGIETFNISTGGVIERMKPSAREDFFKMFVPGGSRTYPYHEINDGGAGRKRMHGKIKLYDKDRNGASTNDQQLVNRIKKLIASWDQYKNDSIDILILSGISGGNGSGTFMAISALAREACRSLDSDGKRSIEVYGYLMLPDTAEEFFKNDDSQIKALHSNGFAALKELESYMSIRLEEGRQELIERQGGEKPLYIGKANPLFDHPVLISGNYKNAVAMIAETIINSTAQSEGGFSQRSFYSNSASTRGMKLAKENVSDNGVLKPSVCPEDSHSYSAIGYAHASIPEKIVTSNIVGKVCGKMYEVQSDNLTVDDEVKGAFCSKDKGLSRVQFENCIRDMLMLDENAALTHESLWEVVDSWVYELCDGTVNRFSITYDQAVLPGNCAQYYEGFDEEKRTNDAIKSLQGQMVSYVQNLLQRAKEVISVYGPKAIEYLYYGIDPENNPEDEKIFQQICFKSQFEHAQQRLTQLSLERANYPDSLDPVRWFQILKRIDKKHILAEWETDCCNIAKYRVHLKIADKLKGERGEWQLGVASPVKDFVDKCVRFSEVLETLAAFYRGNGISLNEDTYEEFAQQGGGNNGINLCQDSDMYKWVQDTVSKKIQGIKITNVKREIADDFFSNMGDWISGIDGVARNRFDEVMSSVCGLGSHAMKDNGIRLTIADYFEHILKDKDSVKQKEVIEATINEIMERLISRSSPSLNAENIGTTNVNILIPQGLTTGEMGELIKDSFDAWLNRHQGGRAAEGSGVIPSWAVDEIVCYQTADAVAVADLKDLTKWENAYDSVCDMTTHLNDGEQTKLHMDIDNKGNSQYVELTKSETDRKRGIISLTTPADTGTEILYGTGLSWKHYPSINVKRYYDEKNLGPVGKDTSEGEYWRVFDKKVDAALRYGIIERVKENGEVYKYYMNIIPNEWTNLDVSSYNRKRNGRFVRGGELFRYLEQQNSSFRFRPKQIALMDSPFFGPDGFCFERKRNSDGWNQEMIDRMCTLYMKRMLRKMTELYQEMEDTLYRFSDIERELNEREGEEIRIYEAKEFVEQFVTGLLNSDGTTWSAVTDDTGMNIPIVSFNRRTLNSLGSAEKALNAKKLELAVVYMRYADKKAKGELPDRDIEALKKSISSQMNDEEYDTFTDGRLSYLQAALKTYDKFVGDSRGDEELRTLINKLNLSQSDEEKAQVVAALYQAAEEVLEEQLQYQ